MSLEKLWYEALQKTEIVQLPIKRLITFGVSHFNYIFLAPSLVNHGDTVVRKGMMDIDRPSLVLPHEQAHFEGFTSEQGPINDDALQRFFYVRGIAFPALAYKNQPDDVDVCEGPVARAEKVYKDKVRNEEHIATGIVIGDDQSWQFSVILMACHMIDQHIDNDLKAILERIRKK